MSGYIMLNEQVYSELKYLNADNLLNGHLYKFRKKNKFGTKFYSYFISSIFEYRMYGKQDN